MPPSGLTGAGRGAGLLALADGSVPWRLCFPDDEHTGPGTPSQCRVPLRRRDSGSSRSPVTGLRAVLGAGPGTCRPSGWWRPALWAAGARRPRRATLRCVRCLRNASRPASSPAAFGVEDVRAEGGWVAPGPTEANGGAVARRNASAWLRPLRVRPDRARPSPSPPLTGTDGPAASAPVLGLVPPPPLPRARLRQAQ